MKNIEELVKKISDGKMVEEELTPKQREKVIKYLKEKEEFVNKELKKVIKKKELISKQNKKYQKLIKN